MQVDFQSSRTAWQHGIVGRRGIDSQQSALDSGRGRELGLDLDEHVRIACEADDDVEEHDGMRGCAGSPDAFSGIRLAGLRDHDHDHDNRGAADASGITVDTP